MPVPDGAVVRGFAFQGNGAEPSARLLSRRRGEGDLRSNRRPGARSCAARVCRIQPGALQRFPGRAGRDTGRPADLRTSAAGERRSGRLRSAAERVGRIHGSVEDRGQDLGRHLDHGGVFAEPSLEDHEARSRTWPQSSLRLKRRTEPGPFRLSFLRERADVSASLFAYPDPKIGGGYFLLLAGLPPQAAKPDSGGPQARGHPGDRPLRQHARREARAGA